ncbi:hypothetical protein CHS0354_003010 [Potamilus streckersoni]|uniref:PPPDE domain-containing protein n=1 Tax=Potamilus streckersoni TaxID=2493646 RepID=A0AAE0SBD9_9BIVA|nr:hypothetical protein CHS0354_003010 [Potamilus streckersoni]
MAEEEGYDVKVYIYDVTNGLARSMSPMILGKQLDGIWHTGLVVYGQEFFFGGMGGIETCQPGGTILGNPTKIEHLGKTQVPYEMFVDYLRELSVTTFRAECYHLLEHNCNSFSSEVAQFLTGKDIPSYVTGLPAEVLSTPFGQMIKPFIDAMSMQPSGGHSLFDQQLFQTPAESHTDSKKKAKGTRGENVTMGQPSLQHQMTFNKKLNEKEIPKESALKKLTPYIHKVMLTNMHTWQEVLSSKDFLLMKEIYQYLGASDQSQWSLSRNQLDMLVSLQLSKELDTMLVIEAFQIMQQLVLVKDFLHLIQHDPKKGFYQILLQFDAYCDDVKEQAIQMISNCCSCDVGCGMVTSDIPVNGGPSYLKQVTQICVSCLLLDITPLCQGAVSTVYNLVINCKQLDGDAAVELGSALFEVLHKELPEETDFQVLTSLEVFMKRHIELQSLAGILAVKENIDNKKKESERIACLCDSISKLILS